MGEKVKRILLTVAAFLLLVASASAATYRTDNFVVTAATEQIAHQVAIAAEKSRETLAIEWLGKEMPNWWRPCNVTVHVGRMGAGGFTTFAFDRGEVFGWRMTVQGSLERILDSAVPHEVTHTVLASHFRRPVPRWADEGAATLAEHDSEKRRLRGDLSLSARMPLSQMLSLKQYPRDVRRMRAFYAQGFILTEALVQRSGKRTFIKFLEDAPNGWDAAFQRHYSLKVSGLCLPGYG